MYQIEKAIDFDTVSTYLLAELRSIGYNPDLEKMYRNIQKMVTELSKLEVAFRRSHRNVLLKEKVEEINNSIDHLRKFILMAKLMR